MVVMKEEKLARKTSAAVTDPTAGVERALLVNPHGSVVKRGETELVMALFEPPLGEGNDSSKINRRAEISFQIIRRAVCAIVENGKVVWGGDKKNAFTFSDKMVAKVTNLAEVSTKVGAETESGERNILEKC